MPEFKRHYGRLKNTDQKVLVVFMQLPGREDHALVVPIDNLPMRFETTLMQVAESQEGQSEPVLANVLGRRMDPISGKSILQVLHEAGMLKPVHVDNVIMLPMPNMPFPLRKILEEMGHYVPPPVGQKERSIPQDIQAIYGAQQQMPQPQAPVQPVPNHPEKHNQFVENQAADRYNEKLGAAKNLLIQAEMLEEDARRKRELAYTYAPELRPANQYPASLAAASAKAMAEAPPPPPDTPKKVLQVDVGDLDPIMVQHMVEAMRNGNLPTAVQPSQTVPTVPAAPVTAEPINQVTSAPKSARKSRATKKAANG